VVDDGGGNASVPASVQDSGLHAVLPTMRRTVIAAAWIAGATIPLFVATIFLVGCCVFPFHGVIHRLMPVCHVAAALMSGHHHDSGHDAQMPMPAREKQQPVKRLVSEAPQSVRLFARADAVTVNAAAAATAYRSFISLGATRCDRDIGLHLLLDIFLI
jgi:hypothetical protein